MACGRVTAKIFQEYGVMIITLHCLRSGFPELRVIRGHLTTYPFSKIGVLSENFYF